jgi:hypothetical protein
MRLDLIPERGRFIPGWQSPPRPLTRAIPAEVAPAGAITWSSSGFLEQSAASLLRSRIAIEPATHPKAGGQQAGI